MNVLEIIRFALRGLTINRLRTALTTLGIMIGVMSVIILIAVGNGSSKEFNHRSIDWALTPSRFVPAVEASALVLARYRITRSR